jgi:hypothetical protein
MMTLEERRVQLRKRTALILVLFTVILLGIGSSAYSYREMQEAKAEASAANDNLVKTNRRLEASYNSLDSITAILNDIRIECLRKQDTLDTLIAQALKTGKLDQLQKEKKIRDNSAQKAAEHERRGYEFIKNGNLEAAMEEFRKCEAAYNGYHWAFEIWRLLRANKENLDDPLEVQRLQAEINNRFQWRPIK